MCKKKLLLVVNPCAGQKKVQKYLMEIINIFNRADYEVITYITGKTRDAEVKVRAYSDKVDLVVCCGGDGTFNETISGVLKSGVNIPIGYIPAGSTNDFAISMQLPTNILQATRDILEDKTVKLDVGMFNERYFSYVASFGLFTKTSYETPQEWKNLLGHAAYILGGIQELSQLKSHQLSISCSNGEKIEGRYIFGAVSNSTSVGGVMHLDRKKVDLQDGRLEVLLIREPKNLIELTDCVRAIQKQTYNSTIITFFDTEHMEITASEEMDWTLDGERESGHKNITIHCWQQAIEVYR